MPWVLPHVPCSHSLQREWTRDTGGASGSVNNNADLDGFDGPMDVTTHYLDIGHHGYFLRIIVRVDEELRTRCYAQWLKEQHSGPFEKSLEKRYTGPKESRKKHYKNLVLG